MPTTETTYTSAMLKQFGYLATWLPGTQLALGLVGVLEGRTFVPKSSIKTLGVDFKPTIDQTADKYLQFQSSKEIKVDVKLAGEVSTDVPTLPAAQAGIAVSFGSETGVVFNARGVSSTRIEDIFALESAIWDLWDRYLWDRDWVVITELVKAERTTVLISDSGYGKVELGAVGQAVVGPLNVGDLSGELAVVSSFGMHTQLVGDEGLTPLFRAVRIRRGLFKGKVTGVRTAEAPTEPGVVPRRGEPRPSGTLIEVAAD